MNCPNMLCEQRLPNSNCYVRKEENCPYKSAFEELDKIITNFVALNNSTGDLSNQWQAIKRGELPQKGG